LAASLFSGNVGGGSPMHFIFRYDIQMEKVISEKAILECKTCNFKCSNKYHLTRHFATLKHNTMILNKSALEKVHSCVCGRVYKHSSSLCTHKLKCPTVNNTPENNIPIDVVVNIMKQSQEIQSILIAQNKEQQQQNLEQQKQNRLFQEQILELSKQSTTMTHNTTTNNNNTTNNNQFNIQFFLNNTCKDALNINDFIRSLDIQVADLEETGNLGFVDGITRIIVKGLKGVDISKRPLHCTDLKRETVYIKNDDAWEKENPEKERLKQAVERVSSRNLQQLRSWQEKHPEFKEIGRAHV
jgi:uncharacterized Zn-finger protein